MAYKGQTSHFVITSYSIHYTKLYDIDRIEIKNVGQRLCIVGDFSKDIEEYKTYSTKVSIISAMMASIVRNNFV